jgi:16S rRNA (uracil1498-N3)-methyltransferase
MTRRRFFAPPGAFNFAKRSVTLTADEARHLREVLRLKAGDAVSVFDGEGKEFRCVVVHPRRELAELELQEQIEPARPESPLRITLAVALLKGEKFDLVVQKATELGVNRFVPLITR